MAAGVTTWAQCRTAIGNGLSGIALTSTFYNIEWSSGFTTTAGNGFVRVDPIARTLFYYTFVEFVSGVTFDLNNATNAIVMDQREADHLIGQNVDLTGPDTFAITADYLTAAGQTVTTTGMLPITAIGLMTPI